MALPKNPSGVSTRTTVDNNVFYFFEVLNENFALLETTNEVKKMREDGSIYTEAVPSAELEGLKTQAEKFIGLFEDYLRGGLCSDDELDLKITELKLEGMKNGEIVKALKINSATLRTRYTRLTKKIYMDLFNQKTVPKGLVELTNRRALNKSISRIYACKVRVSLSECFPLEYRRKLSSYTRGVVATREDVSEQSYVNALYLLFICSREYFDALLSDISPEAMSFVLEQLNSRDYNKVNDSLSYLLENAQLFSEKSRSDIVLAITQHLKENR